MGPKLRSSYGSSKTVRKRLIATPDRSVVLDPGASLTLWLGYLDVPAGEARRTITLEYTSIEGVDDGRTTAPIAVA